MAYLPDNEKSKKKKMLKIKQSLQKEEAEHKLDDLSGSDNEEIDFSKEIHPIGYYINDREKMIEEMFSVIKGEKLKKMLPPVLKKYSLEEMKADCLVHLLGMSKKRIYAILQGRDLNSSSDSETDSTNSVLGSDSSDEPQITSSTHINRSDVEEIDDTLDISVSKNDLDSLMQDKRTARPTINKKRKDKSKTEEKLVKKIKSERSPSLIEISDDEVVRKKKKKDDKRPKKKTDKKPSKLKRKHSKEKLKKTQAEDSSDESSAKESADDDKSGIDVKKGKSLLEILELEMRARAIRALLESADGSSTAHASVSKIKLDPESKPVEVSVREDPPAENIDESDSLEVVVVNDKVDEDAIVILDDADEFIENTKDGNKLSAEVSEKSERSPKIQKEKQIETLPESSKQSSTPQGDKPPETNEKDVTWSQRWAESKGVKTIIQNSKICANIRKRMRFARMLKQKQQQDENLSKSDPIALELSKVEEGSVDQLELIKSMEEAKNKVDEVLASAETDQTSTIPQTTDIPLPNGQLKSDDDSKRNDLNKEDSSKIVDVEIIEKNIECHIDLTDS